MRNIYLDNCSTSFPKAPGVGQAMLNHIEKAGYNVSRGGYRTSYDLSKKVLETREKLCDFFGFDQESNVVFTPNITFSLNYVIHGLLKTGDRLVISSMEHNAVARPAKIAQARGVDLGVAQCDANGCLNLDNFVEQIRPATRAVIILHGSNVCGSLMPIEKIGRLCKERDIFFIVDAAQTAGVFPLNMREMNINGLAFTGHKGLLGPQGIGGLLLDNELAQAISPLIAGGTGSSSDSLVMPDFMPDKLEAGTMNLPGVLGLSAALDYVNKKGCNSIRAKEEKLAKMFVSNFDGRSDVKLIGPPMDVERCPIVSLDFPHMDNAEVAFRLDSEFGIMTRCGLQCAPMAHKTLNTFPQGTVRFSFGHWNTEEEVLYTIEAVNHILNT